MWAGYQGMTWNPAFASTGRVLGMRDGLGRVIFLRTASFRAADGENSRWNTAWGSKDLLYSKCRLTAFRHRLSLAVPGGPAHAERLPWPGAAQLPAVFARWAYGIGRSHHGHHGRTDVRRGSSDRSGGIALTMWSCLVSGIFVTCSNRIKNITTRPAPTYHCRRTRRSPAPSRPSGRRWPCQFWVGCTTNISEREFPTGTGASRGPSSATCFRTMLVIG